MTATRLTQAIITIETVDEPKGYTPDG